MVKVKRTLINTTLLCLTIISLAVPFDNVQATSSNCENLTEIILDITLGISNEEVSKIVSKLEPTPKKVTAHFYGAQCLVDNDTVLYGLFWFIDDKLAVTQAQYMSANDKWIDNEYEFFKEELNKLNITDKPYCPTTDMCNWTFAGIDYSITVGKARVKQNDLQFSQLIVSRRKDSLVLNSSVKKQNMKKELGEALRILSNSVPSDHKLKSMFYEQ